MPPDLNSLPLSSPSPVGGATSIPLRPRQVSLSNGSPPSPRSASLSSSLQQAAAINAGLQRTPSNHSPARSSQGLERRRSSLMNNLSINDPATPASGELQQQNTNSSSSSSPRLGRRPTADPNHQRQLSLGEIHQELENEQEAHVNRLLHMIRTQQEQLAHMQRQQQTTGASLPSSQEASALPTSPPAANPLEQSSPRTSSTSHLQGAFGRPHSLSRQNSARLSNAGTNSRSNSPALRPASGSLGPLSEDFLLGGARDESAFYQAESQMLTRENLMLKQRIRELGNLISATPLRQLY